MRSPVNINDHWIFFQGIEIHRPYKPAIQIIAFFVPYSENRHPADLIIFEGVHIAEKYLLHLSLYIQELYLAGNGWIRINVKNITAIGAYFYSMAACG